MNSTCCNFSRSCCIFHGCPAQDIIWTAGWRRCTKHKRTLYIVLRFLFHVIIYVMISRFVLHEILLKPQLSDFSSLERIPIPRWWTFLRTRHCSQAQQGICLVYLGGTLDGEGYIKSSVMAIYLTFLQSHSHNRFCTFQKLQIVLKNIFVFHKSSLSPSLWIACFLLFDDSRFKSQNGNGQQNVPLS